MLLLAPRKVVIWQQLFLLFYVLLVGGRWNDVVGDFLYTFSKIEPRLVSFMVLFQIAWLDSVMLYIQERVQRLRNLGCTQQSVQRYHRSYPSNLRFRFGLAPSFGL